MKIFPAEAGICLLLLLFALPVILGAKGFSGANADHNDRQSQIFQNNFRLSGEKPDGEGQVCIRTATAPGKDGPKPVKNSEKVAFVVVGKIFTVSFTKEFLILGMKISTKEDKPYEAPLEEYLGAQLRPAKPRLHKLHAATAQAAKK